MGTCERIPAFPCEDKFDGWPLIDMGAERLEGIDLQQVRPTEKAATF